MEMQDKTAEGCIQEFLDNNPNPTAADIIGELEAKGYSISGGDTEGDEESDEDSGPPPFKSPDSMADDAAAAAFGS